MVLRRDRELVYPGKAVTILGTYIVLVARRTVSKNPDYLVGVVDHFPCGTVAA
jgi:hypothetical protein